MTLCFRVHKIGSCRGCDLKPETFVLGFFLAGVPICGQELGLEQYLRRLRSAPGATIEEKVRFLSDMGVTLSSQGLRDLKRAASNNRGYPDSSRSLRRPSWGVVAEGPPSGEIRTSARRTFSYSSGEIAAPQPGVSIQNRVGSFTYFSSDDGVFGTSQRIGNFTFHNFSNGVSGTSHDVGNFTFHNFNNGLSGTSSRVGSFTFHNFHNGRSGTSSRVGNFIFHSFDDGTSCISNRIGRTTFTNCNR